MSVTALPRHAAPESPVARCPRWMPERAGILNVWRYYDEVFGFHCGRLLLRGENGSGKSKALELLLPFLFDANLRANRLSTFGTGERSMHWNLMGEGAGGTTRVGYVWLEFRLDPGEEDEPVSWFCCGARLQASTHTTTVHPDFFTTNQRVERPGGLPLRSEAGAPLTRSALESAIGEHGTVHPNAGEYRAAVRATLFPGMSEQRYDALITALLQLRTPKLSQRLDPGLLSELLSKALPPLDEQEVADLAEGFERLDRQRERLVTLDEEADAAATLATRQRTYARRVLRAGSDALIKATTRLDDLTKTARRSAEQHQRVTVERAELQERMGALADEALEVDGRITGITNSDSYRDGQQLDRLREQTTEARERAVGQRVTAVQAASQAEGDVAAQDTAQRSADQRAEGVDRQRAEASHAATRAGLHSTHAEVTGLLDTDPATARSLLRAAVRGRRDQLDQVREALDQHERAVERREHAEGELENARAELSDAGGRLGAAVEHHDEVRDELVDRVREWASGCRELVLPADDLAAAVEDEPALLELVERAARVVLDEVVRDEAAATAQRAAARSRRDELVTERDRLSVERDLPLPAPPTRTADRSTLTGAPLWGLVRFRDGVAAGDQAGIEAALQASGLLDAWVGHTGAVAGHDVFADPASVPAAPDSLLGVLAPEPDAVVPEPVIERLLGAVAYGPRCPDSHPAAVGADGHWRMGTITGSWSKPEPAHIGALARERARQRRLAELRAELDEVEQWLATVDARLAALTTRRGALATERAGRPGHDELREAVGRHTRAEADVRAADSVVRRQVKALAERERAVAATLRALAARAAEHGLPTHRTGLDALSRAIGEFATQAHTWLDGHGQLVTARTRALDLAERARRSEELAQQRADEAEQAEREHQSLAATLRGVEDSVGVGYRELLTELDRLRRRRRELADEERRGIARNSELAGSLGRLGHQRETDAAARDRALETRDSAAHRFRHLAGVGFAADADLEDLTRFEDTLAGSDGVRASLAAARALAAAWPSVPHAPNNLGDALHRLAESVHACRDTLSGRADLDLETDDEVQLFTATVDGVRVGAAELLAILRAEAEQARHDITERERELFDRTLTGDTRRQLAARIRQADELVKSMNARLERVRTASQLAVRLVWQVAADLPTGTKAARDLLLRDPKHLSDAETAALHRFFRERVDEAKAEGSATSWQQQLAQVFDYTRWHQFVVKLDRANGAGWQPLTRKLHGALSGGEKAIALHLPLFAAVAAHYQAVPRAPRMILLDEVFVGVDSTNRGQVFTLLSRLDLDLMLTSDHEWCTYRELDGIAIHQLITGEDGDDAVTTARFTWDGTTRTATEVT